MHATHNGVIQTFLERITFDTGKTVYITGELGIVLLPILLVMACYVWKQADTIENKTDTL
jgi:hypothetical protein